MCACVFEKERRERLTEQDCVVSGSGIDGGGVGDDGVSFSLRNVGSGSCRQRWWWPAQGVKQGGDLGLGGMEDFDLTPLVF